MSIVKLALSIICIILVVGLSAGQNTVDTVPGNIVTLTGPTPPSTEITYSYLWNIYKPAAEGTSATTAITPVETQEVQFTVPAQGAEDYYTATLLVTDTRKGGCALSNSIKIVVDKKNSCGVSGPEAVCISDTDKKYTYTGDAVLSKNLVYLDWYVDSTKVSSKDTTGSVTVDWTQSPYNTVGTHAVKVEVHSKKGDQKLSECSMNVNVLPLPSTQIAAVG